MTGYPIHPLHLVALSMLTRCICYNHSHHHHRRSFVDIRSHTHDLHSLKLYIILVGRKSALNTSLVFALMCVWCEWECGKSHIYLYVYIISYMDGNDKYMYAGDFEHRLNVIAVIILTRLQVMYVPIIQI